MQSVKNNFGEILARYIRGVYTQSDVNTIFNAFKSDAEVSLLEGEMNKVWEEHADEEGELIQNQQYKAEAHQLLKQLNPPKRRFSISSLLRYAAVFMLLLSMSIGIYYVTANRNASVDVVAYTQLHVNYGEHEQLVLPDGTLVVLNAGSSIRYPPYFTSDERLIELDGEAFFEVKRDEKKPFIVRTENADIRVLGTSFNIKAYQDDEQLMIAVQSGKVQVDMPESMTRLTADEQLILDKKSGDFRKKKEDIKRVKSWIYGGLYFNRTPIRSVVYELQRMYDCDIAFDPQFVYDEYIHGEHDNKSLESVLKSIQYTTDIRYRKEGEKYILYKTQ